jgi:hypothetical protein
MEIKATDIRDEVPQINTTPDQFKVIDDVKKEPTLKEAQAFCGGNVQGVDFPNGDYMIMHEEGKLIGLPMNIEATLLWRLAFDNDNYITGRKGWVAGPVIYIKKKALKQWAA